MISKTKTLMMIALISLLNACGEQSAGDQQFGITNFSIEVSKKNMSILNSNIWNKVDVAAKLQIDQQSYDVRIAYAGATSIDDYKRSYQIQFIDKTYQGYQTLRLSAQYVDKSFSATYLGTKLFQASGISVSTLEPVAVFVNQEYKGLFLQLEMIDSDFYQARHQRSRSLFKASYNGQKLEHMLANLNDAFSCRSQPTQFADLGHMLEKVLDLDTEQTEFDELEAQLDTNNAFKYLATTVLLKNWDGFKNNLHFYRTHSNTPFAITPWDLDRSLGSRREVSWRGDGAFFKRLTTPPALKRRYLKELDTQIANLDLLELAAQLKVWNEKILEAYEADRMLGGTGHQLDAHHQDLMDVLKNQIKTIQRQALDEIE